MASEENIIRDDNIKTGEHSDVEQGDFQYQVENECQKANKDNISFIINDSLPKTRYSEENDNIIAESFDNAEDEDSNAIRQINEKIVTPTNNSNGTVADNWPQAVFLNKSDIIASENVKPSKKNEDDDIPAIKEKENTSLAQTETLYQDDKYCQIDSKYEYSSFDCNLSEDLKESLLKENNNATVTDDLPEAMLSVDNNKVASLSKEGDNDEANNEENEASYSNNNSTVLKNATSYLEYYNSGEWDDDGDLESECDLALEISKEDMFIGSPEDSTILQQKAADDRKNSNWKGCIGKH